jgi:hypothetical protein
MQPTPRIAFRTRTLVQILLVTFLGSFAPTALAGPSRCATDAMDEWSCAVDPRGSAVVDGLGRIVCAPGSCVKHEEEWVCSAVSGGAASSTPEGPVCDGECRGPEAKDCKKV